MPVRALDGVFLIALRSGKQKNTLAFFAPSRFIIYPVILPASGGKVPSRTGGLKKETHYVPQTEETH